MKEITISISQMSREGEGVGRDAEGGVFFVRGAVPGDVVKVAALEKSRKYHSAKLMEVVEASPYRRRPDCTHFPRCGGCDWQHWDYAKQLEAKSAMVQHALARTNLMPEELLPIVASPITRGYRNRIQLRQQGGKIGFYEKQSHRLVEIDRCAITHERLNDELLKIKSEAAREDFDKVELELRPDGGVSVWKNLPHSYAGFRQINPVQNEALRDIIRQEVMRAQSRHVLELFSGDGNLTFAYADLVESVIGFDAGEQSVARAARRAAELGAKNCSFFAKYVSQGVLQNLSLVQKRNMDTILIDPPRSGCSMAWERIGFSHLKTFIYVSCSLENFVRDIPFIQKLGLKFRRLTPIDMFPQTRHVELVGVFAV